MDAGNEFVIVTKRARLSETIKAKSHAESLVLSLGDELLLMKPNKVQQAERIGEDMLNQVMDSPGWTINQYFTEKHGGIQSVSKSDTLLKNTATNGKPRMPPYDFFVKNVDISKKILTLSGYIPPSKKLNDTLDVKAMNTKVTSLTNPQPAFPSILMGLLIGFGHY